MKARGFSFEMLFSIGRTKSHQMKKPLLLAVIAAFLPLLLLAQTSGGPDAFGYTWRNSDDPNGPTFEWVDISAIGTQVSGLTDDNASAFITMGMAFQYYWTTETKIIVGSNGWLSFSSASNIAHCFPPLPAQSGAADNFIAPLMTDLLFGQAGTNAVAYTYNDQASGRYIISYHDVPWWSANAPGYVGLNTFQVILSAADSSITINYLDMDQSSLNDVATCDQDLVVGIENVTGDIGLQVMNEVVPADSFSIKFYYPDSITLAIQDATPAWNQNPGNKGTFVISGTDINLQTRIQNVGNADIVDEINVTGQLQDLNLIQQYVDYDTVPALSAGSGNTIVFSNTVNLNPGQYYFNTFTSNASDVNAGNDQNMSEITAVDMNQPSFVLSHATQNFPIGGLAWTGGGGAGVYIKPPSYPVYLDSVAVFIVDGGAPQDFTIEVYDDDNSNDVPGSLLASQVVSGTSYIANSWVNVPLSTPIEIMEGGVYIGWIHMANNTISLGTENVGPISHQSYEFVGGNWAQYRENATTELCINGIFSSECGNFTINTDAVNHVSCFGGADGSIAVSVNGGTPDYTYNWDHNLGSVEDPSGLNPGVYVLVVTDSVGCQTSSAITINQPTEIGATATTQPEVSGNDGSIDLTTTGGTPPYSYSWNNGSTDEDPAGLAAGDHNVTITDDNGCIHEFTVTVGSEVGIHDSAQLRLSVYPNPNGGQFIITGTSSSTGSIRMFDILGNEMGAVVSYQRNTWVVEMTDASPGLYTIQWMDSETTGVTSVIKQ